MSIGSEITRIRNAKADIISFLKENGISIPDGISIDDLNYYVEQYMAGIPTPPSNSISYIFNSAGSVIGVRFSTEKVRERQCYGMTTLETVTFIHPNTVTSIGEYAFQECTNLALTKLPDGITSIGSNAFYSCRNLALTSLPAGLTSIGNDAFMYCSKLALTELPDGLTSIGETTFYGCSNLASITFKGTPDSIASDAFSYCNNLRDIKVPWSDGAVAGAPWGATRATITYDYDPTT